MPAVAVSCQASDFQFLRKTHQQPVITTTWEQGIVITFSNTVSSSLTLQSSYGTVCPTHHNITWQLTLTSTTNSATRSAAPRRNSTSLGLLNVCSALTRQLWYTTSSQTTISTYLSWRKHGYRLTHRTPSSWTSLPQATVSCIDIVGRQLIDVAEA